MPPGFSRCAPTWVQRLWMCCVSPEAASDEQPKRAPLKRRVALPRMAADAAARQGRVTKLAWDALGDRDAVLAFLNTHHNGLGGRPLDLAIGDADGLSRVEAALREQEPAHGVA
jgi:uncharacterized protein (DUF2384 family)